MYDGEEAHVITGPRVDTPNTHGTGCSTASAIAAELAKGALPQEAVRAAKSYVSCALAASASLRIGSGKQTPFNHGCALLSSLAKDFPKKHQLHWRSVRSCGSSNWHHA